MASDHDAGVPVQYLHPVSLVFALARSVRVFAVPALLLMFSVDRPTAGDADFFGVRFENWQYWLLLPLLPSALVALTTYLSFRLRYESTELVIRSGVLFRNERHVPYARVQNLDAIQNVFHRLLGVVEVRVQTGGGREPEAIIRVLPVSALAEMRRRVFTPREGAAAGTEPEPAADAAAPPPQPVETLLHLPPRELALVGFIDNRGLVVVGAAYGVLWELGLLDRFWDVSVDDPPASPGLVRSLIQFARSGNAALLEYILLAFAGLALLLVLIRLLSMAWAAIRLHDFRLTRVGDDLRTEFGLITHEMTTIPLDRVQTLTIVESPLHRLLKRVSVRVETAGGGGTPQQGGSPSEREWLAPILRRGRIAELVHHVIPGVDVAAVEWRPVHPRAFRRAVKPALLRAAVLPAILILPLGAWAALVLLISVPLAVLGARKRVQYLGWATTEHAALFRSGWLRRKITLARTSKIQAVTLVESPFDRRTAMAQVRVDTAGANERSHRVRIPYLPREAAHELHRSLLDRAANAAFHW